jgi:hypothetical protein
MGMLVVHEDGARSPFATVAAYGKQAEPYLLEVTHRVPGWGTVEVLHATTVAVPDIPLAGRRVGTLLQ